MYLTATRPDLMYVVSFISRFMESPKYSHWKVGKRILRYVAGTLGYGLWYTHTPDSTLTGYTNSDFVGSIDYKKKNIWLCFPFGYKFDLLGISEIAHCEHVFRRSRICSSHHSSLPCSLVKKTVKRYGTYCKISHFYFL